ncbi:MAG: menaquinone biosynthesis protein [Planctomycetota bacterium]
MRALIWCMDPVRIACVRYLNTIPLIAGLDRLEQAQLVMAAPAHIARLIEGGEADVGLVSVADLARSEGGLTAVPAGMIGCDGPTFTVRLYSSVPFGSVREIHVDEESHTSGVLCRLLLRELHGVRVETVPFAAREHATDGEGDWPDTVLLIGDKVVTSTPPEGRYPHQMDLGDAWHGLTGLPFVYAVWACRTEDAESQRVGTASAVLERQRAHNQTRIDWVVTEHAASFGWPMDAARRYLGELLRYDFDARAREGMTRFLSMASSGEPALLPAWREVYAEV